MLLNFLLTYLLSNILYLKNLVKLNKSPWVIYLEHYWSTNLYSSVFVFIIIDLFLLAKKKKKKYQSNVIFSIKKNS